MKNWKYFTFVAIVALFGIIVTFTGCDDNNGNSDPICKCPEKTHLNEGENCNCSGIDCTCTTKINEILINESTRIWKEAGVSLTDFDTIVGHFNQLLASGQDLNDTMIENFGDRVIAIYVGLIGTGVSYQGMVLTVGADETYMTIGLYVVTNILSQPHKSTINAFDRIISVECTSGITATIFNNYAKTKLEDVMQNLDANISDVDSRGKFTTLLDRIGFMIIIELGLAGPNANDVKSMTIGWHYLDSSANDIETIGFAIYSKIVTENIFF